MPPFPLPEAQSGAQEVEMDPYVVACRALVEADVPFLVIGAFGVNLYASELGHGIVTYDLDLLMPPHVDVMGRAFESLARAGFTFQAGGEEMPVPTDLLLGDIVRARACVTAVMGKSHVDLVLHALLLDFEQLWPRRRMRTIGSLTLAVAPLDELLLSKAAANRTKDRLFIETWRELLDEMLAREERRRARGE